MCQYSQQNLSLILKRDFNWKMLFNPNPSKQAQEAFSEKKETLNSLYHGFETNIKMEKASYQKHLYVLLDIKLNFKQYIDNAIMEVNKGITVINNLGTVCHKSQYIKPFCGPLLIMDHLQPSSIQYKAALAITEPFKIHLVKRSIKN